MSDDNGAAVIDAALDSTPETTTTTEITTSLDDSPAEVPAEGTEVTEGKETETHKADGSERTEEEQEDFRAKAAGREPLPAEVRIALRGMRDADPKNASVVKALHGAFERWREISASLGTGEGAGIVGFKNFLQEAGVKNLPELRQAYASQTQMHETVKATDQMLYAGDKALAKNVWEDIKASTGDKAAGVFSKNVANLVEELRTNPETKTQYYNDVSRPNLHSSLMESKFPTVLNALYEALNIGDTKNASAVLGNIISWWNQLDESLSEESKINKAREEWTSQQREAEGKTQTEATTKWENSVSETADKSNNSFLSKSLAPFLKMPFFRGYGKENLQPLGNALKANLYAALKSDKIYQTNIASLWKQGNTPTNNARIQETHDATVKALADRIVRETVQRHYPGYAKGGSASGKAQAQTDNKAKASASATQSVASGKPIYVASRPENLVRDFVKIGGKEYQAEDLRTLQVMGRGFVKTPDGKGFKFITWRR